MVILIPDTPTDGGIYRYDQNEETRPTMVSEVGKVAGISRVAIALMNRVVMAQFSHM